MSANAIGRNRDVDLGLVGNIDTILAALTQAVAGRVWKDPEGRTAGWNTYVSSRAQAVEARLPRLMNDQLPIHPYRLAHEIDSFLTDRSIFIGDGGDVVTFAGNVIQPRDLGSGWIQDHSAPSVWEPASRWPQSSHTTTTTCSPYLVDGCIRDDGFRHSDRDSIQSSLQSR